MRNVKDLHWHTKDQRGYNKSKKFHRETVELLLWFTKTLWYTKLLEEEEAYETKKKILGQT